MPIYGKTLREVVSEFRDHLNSLLAKTITPIPLFPMYVHTEVDGEEKEVVKLGFRAPGGGAGSAEIQTRYGPVNLYLGQTCDAIEVEGTNLVRLRTVSYAYSIQPIEMEDQLIRWEYVRFPGQHSYWNQHHVQGQISFGITDDRDTRYPVNFNDWHLPTGWVSIESVIRFCLHDLEARTQLEQEQWHRELVESAAAFQTEINHPSSG